MSCFVSYIDASGIHMPTYEDRLLGKEVGMTTYETGI